MPVSCNTYYVAQFKRVTKVARSMQSGTHATANRAPLDLVANDLSGHRGAKNASGPVGLYYTSLAQASMASSASVDSWLSKTNLT